MNGRLIGILFESGVSLIAGLFLAYLGFFSPVFRRSSERLAPDRWVGTFRAIARIVGPLLCIIAVVQYYISPNRGIQQSSMVQARHWREMTSAEGRFRISAPDDFTFTKKVLDVPYGRESRFNATGPTLGFVVSFVDVPATSLTAAPNEFLNGELDEHVHAASVELLSRETTRFAGYPAVRFKLHYVPGGDFVEGILLFAKGRLYQLAVHFTSESSTENRERFFNSFQVLDGS